jgi:hypothetical protein
MSAAIELAPELDAAVRTQLREGEVVAYARQPRMQRDLHAWGRIWRFDTKTAVSFLGILLAGAGLGNWVVGEIRGTEEPFHGPLGSFFFGSFFFGSLFFGSFLLTNSLHLGSSVRERRVNTHSLYAVTNQRVLRIATWPKLKVDAWEASAVTEVSRRDIKPDCGNVRYLKGIYSHDGNALMFVPAPEACESAVRALLGVTTPQESQLA